MRDEMTPAARAAVIASGGAADRLPCNPNIANGVARIYGCKISEFNHNPQAIAAAQMAAYRRFGCDSLRIFTDLFPWAEAMGADIIMPEDDTADLRKPALGSIDEIHRLRPANPHKDGRLPVLLDAMKYLQDLAGDEIKCSAGIVGPFTNAFFLFDATETLKLLRKNPAAVHKLCRISLETCLAYTEAVLDIGLNPAISEPMSSCTVVNPNVFREFSLPYLKELVRYIQSRGVNPIIHICGQTNKIWRDTVNLNIGGLSIDNVASLKECKLAVGSETKIMGNIDPGGVMFLGAPIEVRIKILEGILDAWDSPKGYVVMSGCSLPVDTPLDNIQAMMDAVRDVGYPVRPQYVEDLLEDALERKRAMEKEMDR
jgi:uroporphyrinogen decarboxylase